MPYLILWWFLLLLIGVAALPLTLRFLAFLPDRGYAFTKPLGLLLWVYPFWLLASFGFLQNSFGALAVILGLVALASWGLARGQGKDSVGAWLRAHWKYALVVEAVFGVAFLAFAYYRAFNPEISATEKPMEFMFLNSILASDTFPPRDAWLSGFAISYYYLGYVIVAALAKLGNIPSAYAFNLGLIMTFALAAAGAFGLVFNTVSYAQRESKPTPAAPSRAPYVFGVIAVFLLLVIGNFEGVFEAAYNQGIGSREFYSALNLHGLDKVEPSGTLVPQDNWWWWRASRVVNDRDPASGGPAEVIDEFPAFSFLLGDLHPHVLALPFGLLALAIALNLLVKPQAPLLDLQSLIHELASLPVLMTVLIVGSLGMLNTWDIVTYGLVIAAAFAIAHYRAVGKLTVWVTAASVVYLLLLFIGGYLLFLPFYLGFSSQARGIAPNIFNRTSLAQYLIMFGLFIFILASFAGALFLQQPNKRRAFMQLVEFAVPLLLVPLIIALGGLVLLTRNPDLQTTLAGVLKVLPQDAGRAVLGAYAQSFLTAPGVFLLLVVLIAAVAALGRLSLTERTGNLSLQTTVVFALLLALVGLVLTFGTEFLYIRDTFESRMNTVFKLYYQSWLLMSMAAAFGAYYIWETLRGAVRAAWLAAFALLIVLSLVYPVLAFPNRANGFKSNPAAGIPTLDGWQWVRYSNPDDYAAIEWVRTNVPRTAVILEATGPEYSFYNRVSAATGLPTVLGWAGHELQWRGNYDQAGPREKDVAQIYKSRDLTETRSLLDKYSVQYVIVGSQERDQYQLNQALVDKFGKIGELVLNQGTMRIYRVASNSGVSFNSP